MNRVLHVIKSNTFGMMVVQMPNARFGATFNGGRRKAEEIFGFIHRIDESILGPRVRFPLGVTPMLAIGEGESGRIT